MLDLLPDLPPEEPKPVIQVMPPAAAPAPAQGEEPVPEEEEEALSAPPQAVSAFAPVGVPAKPPPPCPAGTDGRMDNSYCAGMPWGPAVWAELYKGLK